MGLWQTETETKTKTNLLNYSECGFLHTAIEFNPQIFIPSSDGKHKSNSITAELFPSRNRNSFIEFHLNAKKCRSISSVWITTDTWCDWSFVSVLVLYPQNSNIESVFSESTSINQTESFFNFIRFSFCFEKVRVEAEAEGWGTKNPICWSSEYLPLPFMSTLAQPDKGKIFIFE